MTGTLPRLAGTRLPAVLVPPAPGPTRCSASTNRRTLKRRPPRPVSPTSTIRNPLPGAVAALCRPTAAPEIARVYFAPVVGVSVDKAEPLSKRLGPVGSANGVASFPPMPAESPTRSRATSPPFPKTATTVIHVWDVITPSGQRVHRIQGQETVPARRPIPGPRSRPRRWKRSPIRSSPPMPRGSRAAPEAWRVRKFYGAKSH
jgi:hypothetical protein